jgi:hypothetical protein
MMGRPNTFEDPGFETDCGLDKIKKRIPALICA